MAITSQACPIAKRLIFKNRGWPQFLHPELTQNRKFTDHHNALMATHQKQHPNDPKKTTCQLIRQDRGRTYPVHIPSRNAIKQYPFPQDDAVTPGTKVLQKLLSVAASNRAVMGTKHNRSRDSGNPNPGMFFVIVQCAFCPQHANLVTQLTETDDDWLWSQPHEATDPLTFAKADVSSHERPQPLPHQRCCVLLQLIRAIGEPT